MALNDVYLIKVQGRLFSQATINTFHYKETLQITAGDNAAAIATAFNAAGGVAANLRGTVSSDWMHETTSVQRIRPLPMNEAVILTQMTAGTRASGSCPPQVAAVVTRRTGLAGRANRGRIYVPAIPESDHENGKCTAAFFVQLIAFASFLDDVITVGAGGISPVVHSKRLNGVPRDVTILITGVTPRDTLYTQRRRTLGRGI